LPPFDDLPNEGFADPVRRSADFRTFWHE